MQAAINPQLEQETPMALLLGGEGEVVAQLLEEVSQDAPA